MSRKDRTMSVPAAFVGMKSDYAAAKQSRFRRIRTGLISSGSGADFHYRSESDYLRITEYARDMERNDAVIQHALSTATTNAIQDGMWPDPQTGDSVADVMLLDRFRQWGEDKGECSIDGTKTFPDMQELAFRSTLRDGDIFALPTNLGALELAENHRCRTPSNTVKNVVLGILLDQNRRRMEYWFTRDEINPMAPISRVSDMQQYAAFDAAGWPQVFHIFDPKRSSQTRGISALAPVFDVAGMFEDIQFAKLVQQQAASCFAVIREIDGSVGDQRVNQRMGEQEVDAYADGARKIIEQIAPGMEWVGNPGEKLQGFSPNIPNPGAMEHFNLMLTLLGINLGLPLILLMMDASQTNFSGWRGAVDQARMGFRRNQRWFIDHFLKPVYLWKIRQWTDPLTGEKNLIDLAKRLAAEGKNIYQHKWTCPKWPYIQPLQDAQADDLRIKSRQISPRRQLAERGYQIDEIHSEIIEDNYWLIERAITASKKLLEATGVEVDWHQFLYVPNVIDQKPGLPASPISTIQADPSAETMQ